MAGVDSTPCIMHAVSARLCVHKLIVVFWTWIFGTNSTVHTHHGWTQQHGTQHTAPCMENEPRHVCHCVLGAGVLCCAVQCMVGAVEVDSRFCCRHRIRVEEQRMVGAEYAGTHHVTSTYMRICMQLSNNMTKRDLLYSRHRHRHKLHIYFLPATRLPACCTADVPPLYTRHHTRRSMFLLCCCACSCTPA